MNSSALIMLLCTHVVVTAITVYLFIRVFKTPSRPEPDSYSDNDQA